MASKTIQTVQAVSGLVMSKSLSRADCWTIYSMKSIGWKIFNKNLVVVAIISLGIVYT